MSPPVPRPRAAAAVLVAALLIVVLPVAPGLLAATLAGLIALLMLFDGLLAPDPRRLGVTRDHPRLVSTGERGDVTWRVSNPTGRRLSVELVDELPASLSPSARRAHLTVPSGGHAETSIGILPTRRGLFCPQHIVLRVSGPLGLVACQREIGVASEISVYPPLGSAREADLWVRATRLADVGMRSAQFHGGGTEFDAMRDYGVDDEYRRIDWAATARAGHPVVRTYRAEVDQRVIALVDCGRTMTATVSGVPRFDHALDALLMLTSVSARLGDRCGLVVFDQSVRASVPPERRSGQLGRVSEAVYRVEPSLVESDYHDAFTHVMTRFPRRSMLVLFSELVASAVEESLVPALAMVAREHRVVVAAVTDPQVVDWSRQRPRSEEEAYRKAAAIWTLERRRLTTALLASRGVTVVDRPPGELPRALADVYTRAKALGTI